MIFIKDLTVMITVIDTTAYAHCSPRNYKQIPVEEAIPKEPCLTYSRYEVLQQKIRKIYFDFDGVPDNNFALIREFIEDYNTYIISKGYVKEPIEFACTMNSNSPNHPGIGSHIIAKRITMDATKQHTILLGFLSEFANASKYKQYLDTSVYSMRQLFKLPHFIGLPMVNPDNYHCMLEAEDITEFVIQKITGCTYLNPSIEYKQEWRKAEKHLSFIPRGNNNMVKALYNVILNKRSGTYHNVYKYIDRCQELLLNEHITEPLKNKLNGIINDLREKRNIETSVGLIEHIAKKLERL